MGQDWLKTTLILSPVFALMAWASFYLWRDYRPHRTSTEIEVEREIFGTVFLTQNNVKRKTSDSALWNALNKSELLYYRDSIRTGPESTATLRLRDNSVIELGSNTLIVLEKSGNQIFVDFKTGDLHAKNTSKDLSIRVKDSTIQAQGADLSVKSDEQKVAQIEVTKGKALLLDGNKNKKDLGVEDIANIGPSGVTQRLATPVVLEAPVDKLQILSPTAEVKSTFSWRVLDNNLNEEVLEISQDSFFPSDKTQSYPAHQSFTANLKQGINYWRVAWKPNRKIAGQGAGLLHSEFRVIQVREDLRVKQISPVNNSVVETTLTENEVEFTWSAEGNPSSYLLEISDGSGFQRIVQSHKSFEPKLKVTHLKNGRYWWRVTAFGDKNENKGQSVGHAFEVRRAIVSLPILVSPDDGFGWQATIPVRMEWKKAEHATSYRVLISRDREQKQIIKSATASNSPYTWNATTIGNYFWSVEGLDTTNEVFAHSIVRSLNITAKIENSPITLQLPLDKADVNRERKDPVEPVTFEWSSDKLTGGEFTLMISKSPGFEKFLKTENIPKNRVTVRLTESATYYWKVTWVDLNDKEHVEVSPINTLKYAIAEGLSGPELIEPIRGFHVRIPFPQPVDFSWKPVEKAAQYRMVIERLDDRNKTRVIVFDKLVKETHFLSPNLPEGEYEWRVHTLDEKEIQGIPSESRKLSVRMKDLFLAPKLKPLEIK